VWQQLLPACYLLCVLLPTITVIKHTFGSRFLRSSYLVWCMSVVVGLGTNHSIRRGPRERQMQGGHGGPLQPSGHGQATTQHSLESHQPDPLTRTCSGLGWRFTSLYGTPLQNACGSISAHQSQDCIAFDFLLLKCQFVDASGHTHQ
jgi:hypothetical protein